MRLRTVIVVAIACLVAVIVAATVFAVVIFVGRAERRDLETAIERSERVFADLLGYRESMFRSDCRVVANEPRLRAVVATQDISRETVLGVVNELTTSLGSDLFLLTDGAGLVLADVLDPEAEDFDLSEKPVVAAALTEGEGSGVWIADGRPYQVQACRIDFGAQTVGIVLIGHVIGDEVPLAVHQHTGSTAVVTVDERAVAVSPLAGGRPAEAGELDDVTAGLGPELREIEVAGSHYLARGGQLPGYSGEREVAFAVLRSLDEALAPGRRLTHSVLAIAGLALVGAFLLAIPISRRLSRTVDQLVQFTARVGKGDLDARAAVAGAAEVKLLASAMNQMVSELHESRRELARKERLEREMEIAMRIQTSILPTSFEVHGLDIAAHMVPASEVGGDYYDVLPVHDGCWIGIGDVAGHGLTAGLEMLMVQSVVAALVRENPDAAPKSHLHVLNQVIFDNIRNRLKQDEHVTLTLLRYRSGGAIDFAGAHEDILICRAGADKCVRVMTPGTWVGAVRDISQFTKDSSIELEPGALMVLYSDGVTEARDGAGEQFGIERLEAEIERSRREPVGVIRDRVVAAVEAWQASQEDDISIVVLRRKQPQKG